MKEINEMAPADHPLDLLHEVLAIPLESEDLHAELQAIQDRIRGALASQAVD